MMGVRQDSERVYRKWISFVRDALNSLDCEYSEEGCKTKWNYLPGHGGLYDQDEFFMQIWEMIRIKYIKALSDESFMKSIRGKYGKSKP